MENPGKNESRNSVPSSRSELGTRLAEAASLVGSRKEAALAAEVSVASLQRYIAGNDAPASVIAFLAAKSGISAQWILTGEGPKYADERDRASEGRNQAPAPRLGDDFAMVTVYDVEASAGHGASVEQERPLTQIAFRKDWLRKEGLSVSTLAAITVSGDSMEPTLADGALLLLDTAQRQVGGDAIYILRLDGHLYAKRLQRLHDGSVRISSDNKAYADELVGRDQVGDLDIIGRVVWVGHRM